MSKLAGLDEVSFSAAEQHVREDCLLGDLYGTHDVRWGGHRRHLGIVGMKYLNKGRESGD